MLSYTSEELDRDLEVIGPVEMVLFAASSAKDTDFIVRVCDVYPDGRSIFLTEGILRARYRNSHEGDSTELLEPGEAAEYRIRCYPMANVFERGHRIRLDVTSSSFPRFSRNLNNGEDVGTSTRIEVAQQTVLHTDVYPSHVAPAGGRDRELRPLRADGPRHRLDARDRPRAGAGARGGGRARGDQRPHRGDRRGGGGRDRRSRRRAVRRHRRGSSSRSGAALGPVDVLVNNTGMTLRKPIVDLELDEWRELLDVNLTSAFVVGRAVAPGMIERGRGKVVNVCSVMSDLARPTTGAYAATKGGLKMLTRAMCAEWAPHGIQANGIAPGFFRTDLTEALQANAEFDTWLRARVPAGRWGEPDELAGAVVFLASSASDFVNGQILIVDGGLSAVV